MRNSKKPAAAMFLVAVILAAVVAVLMHHEKRVTERLIPAAHTTTCPAIAPPVPAAGAKIVPLDRRTATRNARRCLNYLCDTGASNAAVAQARAFVSQLDSTSSTFAKSISALLRRVLAFRAGEGGKPPGGYPGIARDYIDRAAAACDARGRRKAGEIVLSFAGDCTFGTVNGDDSAIRFPAVYRRSGRRDYPFALVRPWFVNDDLTVVNFECTLTDAAGMADKQWHFKGPARYAALFPAGSVDAVTLANNHSGDYRQAGFRDSVANFRKAHVPVFFQDTPYVTMLQGVQTVLIGDCTVVGENTTVIDGVPERVLGEIKRYKKPGNIVIVFMHWGSELDPTPRPWQQALGRKFIDAGADAVVAAHPHVLQGVERYKGKYIAYSLGNFAFGGNSLAHFPDTVILRLRFRVTGGKTSVLPAAIVPCWISSGQARSAAGVLRNNYQPRPVFGQTADRTVSLLLQRSAGLPYGVTRIAYLRLP